MSSDDIPYKVEPGDIPHIVRRHDPDPRPKWAHRFAVIGIAITIGACLAAVFVR